MEFITKCLLVGEPAERARGWIDDIRKAWPTFFMRTRNVSGKILRGLYIAFLGHVCGV